MNNIIKYLEYLEFKKQTFFKPPIISYMKMINNIYYNIILNTNSQTVKFICNDKVIYESSLAIHSEELIIYSLVCIIELGAGEMMKENELITNKKCIDRLIEYENVNKNIVLIYNDRLRFSITDKNIIVTIDGTIPVHAIQIDKTVQEILRETHYNKQENLKESRVNFIKTILDGYVDRYEIIKNFINELESFGFVLKKDKDIKYYSYRNMIHVRIKCDHVRLYLNQFNKYKRFEITDNTLNDICDYIKNI